MEESETLIKGSADSSNKLTGLSIESSSESSWNIYLEGWAMSPTPSITRPLRAEPRHNDQSEPETTRPLYVGYFEGVGQEPGMWRRNGRKRKLRIWFQEQRRTEGLEEIWLVVETIHLGSKIRETWVSRRRA
ncbi:uncharacterized protein LOC109838153 [Asparagus officinalis]|uniref:uncharacterized protein LOC109838153 n=1 Tax=Asparagus officinalis TaxID=4686 RepID=UPI00098DFC4B|nr:uncharacterized protein LOC109838153 [Asparagus officinalis]